MNHPKPSPRARLSRYLHESVGRRGALLLVFAVVHFGIGLQVLIEPQPITSRFLIYELIPVDLRIVLWFVTAVLGLVAAVSKRVDGFGYAAVLLPTLILTGSNMGSFIGYLLGLTDYFGGWAGFLRWGGFAAVIIICSGWTENPRRQPSKSTLPIVTQTAIILNESSADDEGSTHA